MNNTLVRVLTQYYDENGKPKGGQEFNLRVDADYFMYTKEAAIEAIKKLILNFEKVSNYAGRHEYIDHELIFHESIELDSENFEKEIQKVLEKTEG
jgi:hypothetical protein